MCAHVNKVHLERDSFAVSKDDSVKELYMKETMRH